MSFCPYCGARQVDDALFCQRCGKKLPGQDGAAEPAPPAETGKSRKKIKWIWPVAALLVLAVIVGTVLFVTRDVPFSQDPDQMEQSAQSVVMLECYGYDGELIATGSGFVAFDDSTIVTNYHVVDLAMEVKISTEQDHTIDVAYVLGYDADKDICILKTREPTGLSPLPLGSSAQMKKGEAVTAIGSPLGIKNTVSTGVLSGRIYNDVAQFDELQFSAPISSGSSGGALFNEEGQVVGMTSAFFVDGQNLNLAIPAEEIEKIDRSGSLTLEELVYSSYENIKAIYEAEPVEFHCLYEDTADYNGKTISTQGTVAFVEDQGDTMVVGLTDEDTYEWLVTKEQSGAIYYNFSGMPFTTSILDFCEQYGFYYSEVVIISINKDDIWYARDVLPGDEVEVCGTFCCDYVGYNVMMMVYDDKAKHEALYWSMWDTYDSLATMDGLLLTVIDE